MPYRRVSIVAVSLLLACHSGCSSQGGASVLVVEGTRPVVLLETGMDALGYQGPYLACLPDTRPIAGEYQFNNLAGLLSECLGMEHPIVEKKKNIWLVYADTGNKAGFVYELTMPYQVYLTACPGGGVEASTFLQDVMTQTNLALLTNGIVDVEDGKSTGLFFWRVEGPIDLPTALSFFGKARGIPMRVTTSFEVLVGPAVPSLLAPREGESGDERAKSE